MFYENSKSEMYIIIIILKVNVSLFDTAVNIMYPERITNTEFYQRSDNTPASITLHKQRLKLIGHATRLDTTISILLDKKTRVSFMLTFILSNYH